MKHGYIVTRIMNSKGFLNKRWNTFRFQYNVLRTIVTFNLFCSISEKGESANIYGNDALLYPLFITICL